VSGIVGIAGGFGAGDDCVQPFMLERTGIRGRLLRLGPLIDTIVTRPDYPRPVAHLLAELVALGTVLSSTLKYDGIFTLQTKGDGAVRTMVMDVTSAGDVRGYVGFDHEAVAARADAAPPYEVADWLGQGHVAFTVDQGPHTDRYQGLVELVGPRLTDSLLHYFRQSQQVNAGILVAARQGADGWRASALLIERIPESAGGETSAIADEDWRRSLILMASCTEDELLDPVLSPETLLFRLFHEEGVRVFPPRPLRVGCRCTRERLEGILLTLTPEDLESMTLEDGGLVMTCEFCAKDFRFDAAGLEQISARR